jgi:eukaryotic-like serine/threonine-protein kinase
LGFTQLEQVGKGGMGVVWRARDDETGRIVALKLLRENFADDPDYLSRFEHELEIAKRITSEHVVRVLGYGARDGVPYIAFEFVEGPSLRELLNKHGSYDWPETRAMLLQLAEGLADAHAAGVIHRDVKPGNILIAPGGIAKLADFGISHASDLTHVTRTSGLVGTPAYLAPEGPIDARSDLYSLGIIGFELLTGKPPFEGATYHEVLAAHLRQAPDLARLPAEARPIVGWLLAKDPRDRPQSARQLIRVLTGVESIPAGQATAARMGDITLLKSSDETVVMPKGSLTSWPSNAPTSGPGGASTGTGAGASTGNSTAGPVAPSAALTAPAARKSRPSGAVVLVGAIVVVAIVAGAVVMTRSGGASAGQSPGAGSAAPSASGSGIASLPSSATLAPTAPPTPTPTPNLGTPGKWQARGSLKDPVWGAGAAQLADGRVEVFSVVTGTYHTGGTGTWIVDPNTGTATAGPSMTMSHAVPAVAVLSDGSVIIAGGWGGTKGNTPVATAEMMNGTTGEWRSIAPMQTPRSQATATELPDHTILVAGGWTQYSSGEWTATNSAEIYDPATDAWHFVANMSTERALATATRLKDGRVLVAGGSTYYLSSNSPTASDQDVLSSAEIFDPSTLGWHDAGNMAMLRAAHTAALLPNGHVLAVGGWQDGEMRGLASADEFDPIAGSWSVAADMPGGHSEARLVTLLDGRLLEIGGNDASDNTTVACELYDPNSGNWTRTGSLTQAVYWPATVLLVDGRVFIAGGGTNTVPSGRLQIFAPPR